MKTETVLIWLGVIVLAIIVYTAAKPKLDKLTK